MNVIKKYSFLCAAVLLFQSMQFYAAVTCSYAGRFGDNLVTYCRARWIARKYNKKFIYKPFNYGELLKVSVSDVFDEKKALSKLCPLHVASEQGVNFKQKDVLFIMSSYFKSIDDYDAYTNDTAFINEVRELISPIQPVITLELPKDMLTVALHVRKGGGFDPPLLVNTGLARAGAHPLAYADVGFPMKFPSNQFYLDQLILITELFKDVPLYIFLFTDDPDPASLVNFFAQAINNPHITFDYRKKGSCHNAYVLEDFFSMMKFDCLIRPDSNFSKMCQILGSCTLAISPKHFIWRNNQLIIDEIEIFRR